MPCVEAPEPEVVEQVQQQVQPQQAAVQQQQQQVPQVHGTHCPSPGGWVLSQSFGFAYTAGSGGRISRAESGVRNLVDSNQIRTKLKLVATLSSA